MKPKILIYGFIVLVFSFSCIDSAIKAELSTPKKLQLKSATIGNIYYVANNGNDYNPGTFALPFLTLKKAASVAIAADSVIVKDGYYTTSDICLFNLCGKKGTSLAPIVFKSEHQWGAKLDGQNNKTIDGINISYSSYITFQDFDIYGLSGGGIKISSSCDHILLKGNKIHNIGKMCSDSQWGKTGISVTSSTNITVEKNIIYNIGRFANGEDGCANGNGYWQNHDHGIYISSNVDGLVIAYNLILDCKAGWAIHVYNGDGSLNSNISILNNTFVNPNPNRIGHILLFTNMTNTYVVNNIFYSPLTAAIQIESTRTFSKCLIKNNLTFNGTISNGPTAGFTLSDNLNNTNPLLISPGSYDFKLQSSSPAINAGVDVGLTSDFYGNAIIGRPDIGAFESAILDPSSVTYCNTQTSASATKNNCGSGYTGSTETYTVAAGKYSSKVSQADADSKAIADINANKQTYANLIGTCKTITTTVYYNTAISSPATKNDCGTDYMGSTITYYIPANKYSSIISQVDADNKAIADLNTNKQAYANTIGTCAPLPVFPLGLTTVGIYSAKSGAGYWSANSFTSSLNITVKKISLFVGSASGKARLGIYSNLSGLPCKLLAQTGEISLSNGWNSGPLEFSLDLVSGVTYWLAAEVSSSTTTLYFNSSSERHKYKSYSFGPMPSPAPIGCASGSGTYSIFAD